MMNFICGHSGNIPTHMGRGQARQERLTKYFNRKCPSCRHLSVLKTAQSLYKLMPGTDQNGKRNMRPYNEQEIQDFVRKHS